MTMRIRGLRRIGAFAAGLAVLASAAFSGETALLPYPHSLAWGDGVLRPEAFRLDAAGEAGDAAATWRRELDAWLAARGVAWRDDAPARWTVGLDAALPREGYRLRVDADGVTLEGGSAAGILYGVFTFMDMGVLEGGRFAVPHVTVEDAPANAWRGAFFNFRNADPARLDTLKALVRAMARLKMNVIVAEFSSNLRYPGHTFNPNGFTPEQVREWCDHARAYGVDVVPYFQAVSHALWLTPDPAHRQYLENPATTGWDMAWCPSNPGIAALFKKVLRDTVDIFRPRRIHLGLDEISLGPYRECDACRAATPEGLLKRIVLDYHGFLAEQGVETVLFHDEFLPPTEQGSQGSKTDGWKILDDLPRGLIFHVWKYSGAPEVLARQTRWFSERGFPVLGAGMNQPDNLADWSRLMADGGGLGLVNTYWYEANDWSREQISPSSALGTALTAAYAWNPDTTPEQLGGRPAYAFMGAWRQPGRAPGASPAHALPLPTNVAFGFAPTAWPGAKVAGESAAAPTETHGSTRVPFTWRKKDQPLWLDGDERFVAPELTFAPTRAEGVRWVHACSVPPDIMKLRHLFAQWRTPTVGKYTVAYEDGEAVDIPLRFRMEIADWNDDAGPMLADAVYLGLAKKDLRIAFSALEWKNPRPDVPLVGLRMKAEAGQGLACAAVFLVGNETPEADGAAPNALAAGAASPGRAPAPDQTLDAFAYADEAAWRKVWKPGFRGFADEPRFAIRRADGENELMVTVPPGARGEFAHLVIDRSFAAQRPVDADTVFYFDMEIRGASTRFAFYLGDDTWKRYVVDYRTLQTGTHRLFFTMATGKQEGGEKLAPADIRQVRLSFFGNPNSAATDVSFGPIRYGSPRLLRDLRRGRAFYELVDKPERRRPR